nr:hypothetical protein [Kibdelosporangium sp. MJ126-NF4]
MLCTRSACAAHLDSNNNHRLIASMSHAQRCGEPTAVVPAKKFVRGCREQRHGFDVPVNAPPRRTR